MLLDNQLQVWESSTGMSRMCGNVEEVRTFLKEITGYDLTDIESRAIDATMRKVLPFQRKAHYEPDRHLIVTTDGEHLGKWYEDSEEEKPEGMRVLGVEYRGALSSMADPVAQFTLGKEDNFLRIQLWRRLGEESMPYNVVRQLWQQQVDHILSPSIPNVKADLVPFLSAQSKVDESSSSGFTVNIRKDSFQVKTKEDMVFLLETLMGHSLSKPLAVAISSFFQHLSNFPKKLVSSAVVPLFVDKKGILYVGGEGMNNGRPMRSCGKLYPQFFTGLAGNVFALRLGMFEDIIADMYVMRN